MPIPKKWSRVSKNKINGIPKGERGAYELANREKRTIYQGGSDSSNVGVRSRLKSHIKRLPTAKYYRYETAGIFDNGISMEASHSKKFQEKHGRKPRYTQRSPRKKSFFDL
jgi:hypothetical protein